MPPARNERVKFNVDFLSVSINQSNGLLKTVRLPVLFGSLVIFPSNDGQITSSRVLFAMKEFIQDKSQPARLLSFARVNAAKRPMCPPLRRERIPGWFCDNLSDYIIFRRRSTGGDFSVPQYIHSFGAIPNFSSLGIRRQNLDSFLRQLQTRTDPDKHHIFA